MTAAQANRYSLMRQAGIDQKTIAESLAARGVDITRQSVGLVIRNKWVNDDVIAEFCTQTKSTRAEAWPDVPDVPAEPTKATA